MRRIKETALGIPDNEDPMSGVIIYEVEIRNHQESDEERVKAYLEKLLHEIAVDHRTYSCV